MADPLKEHLAELSRLSQLATTKQDIKHITSLIEKFSQTHSYKKKQPLVLAVILLSAVFGIATVLDGRLEGIAPLLGATFLISLIVYFSRASKATIAGKELMCRAIEIENKLSPQKIDGEKLWYELQKKFPIFNDGDEGQEITKLYSSTTECGIPFSLFEFEYVDVDEEESTDSDGNTQTETTRTTHYTYGVLCHLKNLSGFSINSRLYRGKWNTASKKFNRMFRVRCESEMLPAKFFTPSVILEFEERFKALKAFEANNEEQCFVFSSKIMPSEFAKGSIKQTSEFLNSLENPPRIAELHTAKELISYIDSKVNKNLKTAS
jgi:hypothetical protein